jgi:hypothetical protein
MKGAAGAALSSRAAVRRACGMAVWQKQALVARIAML